jgi:two-component system NtrC family sensor kinase
MSRKVQPDDVRHRAALRRYDPASPADSALDDLTALAAHVCGGASSVISLISLVDGRCLGARSKSDRSVGDIAGNSKLLAHVTAEGKPLIVPDTTQDARFADDPLVVGEPQIRFYAGEPLITTDGDFLAAPNHVVAAGGPPRRGRPGDGAVGAAPSIA